MIVIDNVYDAKEKVWKKVEREVPDDTPDQKEYIPEYHMIADKMIESGKYFTVSDQMYLSTAKIAKGAEIVPGSNCTEIPITAALNALNINEKENES